MIGIIKINADVNACFILVEIEEPNIVPTTYNQLSEIDHNVIEDNDELLTLCRP
jgi:hypothetical protein